MLGIGLVRPTSTQRMVSPGILLGTSVTWHRRRSYRPMMRRSSPILSTSVSLEESAKNGHIVEETAEAHYQTSLKTRQRSSLEEFFTTCMTRRSASCDKSSQCLRSQCLRSERNQELEFGQAAEDDRPEDIAQECGRLKSPTQTAAEVLIDGASEQTTDEAATRVLDQEPPQRQEEVQGR